ERLSVPRVARSGSSRPRARLARTSMAARDDRRGLGPRGREPPVTLTECAWSRDRSGELIAALAASAGFPLRDVRLPRTDDIAHAAEWLGVETEPVEAAYEDVDALLASMAPAIVELPGHGLLAVAQSSRRRALILAPDGRRRRVPASALRAVLVRPL